MSRIQPITNPSSLQYYLHHEPTFPSTYFRPKPIHRKSSVEADQSVRPNFRPSSKRLLERAYDTNATSYDKRFHDLGRPEKSSKLKALAWKLLGQLKKKLPDLPEKSALFTSVDKIFGSRQPATNNYKKTIEKASFKHNSAVIRDPAVKMNKSAYGCRFEDQRDTTKLHDFKLLTTIGTECVEL